jgi:uncharacterized membrane protein
LPLAGLVLVTDGADTSEGTLDEHLASLKARSIPVFPVGLGRERFDRDIEITRVEMPRVTLKGTSLSVDVVLKQTGFGGQSVPLQVEDEGRILSSQQVTLPRDGEAATVRVTFAAKDAGARLFRFRVPPQTDEQVTQNNTRDALVQVSNRREKILYMEGEPRYEVKFIRRAVEDDENLQVVVLLRTAEEKYWRGDVESAEELVGGFPKTREELFAYRAIILGSIEAASFSPDQLRMLADFVSKRGGGLMMIGGRRAFAEGGWAGTPVAEVLPVELEAAAANKGNQPEALWVSVKPTRAGTSYPVTQLGDSENDSTTRWGELPRLTTVNPMNRTKPGAVVLLNGTDDRRQEHVVLAYQRYGRGKSMAFPMQDSFIWKMDATIPVEDTTHSTFWRRLVRWLVDGVPDSVALSTSVDRVEPGETVSITAEVVDKAFVEVNDAHVTATVTSPSGKTTEVAMQWTVAHDGEYRGTYVPDEAGQYEIKASAVRNDQELGTNSMPMRASAGDSEYFDAAMRSSLLRRIAEETGGHFFTPADAAKLPEAISYSGRGVTVVEERDLWDMPIILVLILGLIAAEWLFRRKLGLA